jgi:hypothetical protein
MAAFLSILILNNIYFVFIYFILILKHLLNGPIFIWKIMYLFYYAVYFYTGCLFVKETRCVFPCLLVNTFISNMVHVLTTVIKNV